MRISYDFENDYKDIQLGKKLERLLSFPKRFIENKLSSIRTEMEQEEALNVDACVLIEGIMEDEPAITIVGYSTNLTGKINSLLTWNDKMYLLTHIEEMVLRNFK